MDDLIVEIRKAGIGCHIANLFIASILYADDVCLLAPSRSSMQTLLDICSNYAASWCIKFNGRKSKLMYFGKAFNSFPCAPIYLDGTSLEFTHEWKYLGVNVKSGKGFSCSILKPRSAFYRSCNSILNVLKGPSEIVQMKLLYSICVPILTYASDAITYNNNDLQSIHVAVNIFLQPVGKCQDAPRILWISVNYGNLCKKETVV